MQYEHKSTQFSHLDQFPDNLGDHTDKQGERLHQNLKVMEDRYKGRWDISMLADYCWSIKRDEPLNTHRRVSKKGRFMALCEHYNSYTLTLPSFVDVEACYYSSKPLIRYFNATSYV